MLTEEQTEAFVQDWFHAWNRHDIEAVLSRYAENAEVTSPLVAKFMPASGGAIHGVAELRIYFKALMGLRNDLYLEPIDCFMGAESLVLHYRGLACLRVAEVVELDDAGKVTRTVSHCSRAIGSSAPKTWRVAMIQSSSAAAVPMTAEP